MSLRAVVVLILLGASGCSKESTAVPGAIAREGRFGSLRDLVVFDRPAEQGGPFFLDRFEVTRDDWTQFLGAPRRSALEASTDGFLPQSGIDLAAARAFAAWRFCRLPRAEEWVYAATGNNTYSWPWGDAAQASRANTAELRLGKPTPVGTFESGRRGDGPYDLVGNVAEWTETVPPQVFLEDPPFGTIASWPELIAIGPWRMARAKALSAWLLPGQPLPASWLVQSLGERIPRIVVGSDFLSPMGQRNALRLPRESGSALGLRLAADPASLLATLTAGDVEAGPQDLELLRRFLGHPGHAEVLRDPLRQLLQAEPARGLGPVGRVLTEGLAP